MSDEDLTSQLLTNLPALAAPAKAGALKAFSQLLGGMGAYATAWLRRPTQAIEDKTDAKSLMIRRIADAAATKAAHDPELIEHAIATWLPSELRRQSNKQAVVLAAIEAVKEDHPHTDRTDGVTGEIDDEWLNSFERFAEDASSDRMRNLWGRVLSGEIQRPGTFSRPTLRFLHELDQKTAESFEAISRYALVGNVFTIDDDDNFLFKHLLHLDSVGAVTGVGGLVSWQTESDERGIFSIPGTSYGLIGLTTPKSEIMLDATPLTQSGRELLKIVKNPDEEALLLQISERMKKPLGFDQIEVRGVCYAQIIENGGSRRLHKLRQLWGDDPFL